ncbi:CsbD family protein [Luteipulveratus halotolerans]|uniref:CsbD family protein n=1 Tax=Luteipulveratus halotolerans TaxID=1631356 RepID=UPI0008FBE88B|nr:CsbD family protein [Luteipulveratus halotolerans]
MGLGDKAKHAAQNAMGKAKEATGKARGDEEQKEQGRSEQVEAQVKRKGDDVKDVFDQ